jgi:alpha-D-ribose 1-methylphosphonate 5-triphosphate synthase subunit PhnL
MFYQGAISDANLEATLYGWSLNPATATGVDASQIDIGRTYAVGSPMDLALNDPTNGLVAAKGWNVTGITIV